MGPAVQGRRVLNPCGHEAEVVIGTFTICVGVPTCDGRGSGCKQCGSRKLYPFVASHLPDGTMACEDCGSLRWTY